jgi:hypothetical protein
MSALAPKIYVAVTFLSDQTSAVVLSCNVFHLDGSPLSSPSELKEGAKFLVLWELDHYEGIIRRVSREFFISFFLSFFLSFFFGIQP